MAGKAAVKPGEATTISATLKTAGHVGGQNKTITVETSDPETPLIQLVFSADIYAPTPVPGAERTPKPSPLFVGDCATCHATPAAGKQNAVALYNAVCFMCHGDLPGVPAPVPAVTPSDRIAAVGLRDAKLLRGILTDGLPQTEMPPFGRKWQGPLSDDQIGILADFIAGLRPSPPRPVKLRPGPATQPMRGQHGGSAPATDPHGHSHDLPR